MAGKKLAPKVGLAIFSTYKNPEYTFWISRAFLFQVVVPKAKGEILGVVIVESGWGSMLPTIVLANLLPTGPAARCGQLNIGDQVCARCARAQQKRAGQQLGSHFLFFSGDSHQRHLSRRLAPIDLPNLYQGNNMVKVFQVKVISNAIIVFRIQRTRRLWSWRLCRAPLL